MKPRHNGTDPIIDEDYLVEALDVLPLRDNVRQMQSGALMLVVNSHDRQLTRDQYLVAASTTIQLVDAVARFSMMQNIKDHLANTGVITLADVETALLSAGKKVKVYTDEAIKVARLIKQCPTSEDQVH